MRKIILTTIVLSIFINFAGICAAADKNYKDSPFGFHWAAGTAEYAGDIGAKWIRINAVWGVLQANDSDLVNGVYHWDKLEKGKWRLDKYPENMNFIITFSYLGTPVMRSDSYVPNVGLYNKENWIKFVKAVVSRYKDKVMYYQVENEPKESKKDYAELLEISYIAAKSECPDCKMLIAGPAYLLGSTELFDKNITPILYELKGKYVDVIDQHWFGNKEDYFSRSFINHIKKRYEEAGFPDLDIWMTENGTYSGKPYSTRWQRIAPLYQSEKEQSVSLVKRYVYSISMGVRKVFWAFGMIEGFQRDNTYFDHTGLIYDGQFHDDPGRGVKKLGYYSYKKMVEMLEGSDWDNIEVKESNKLYLIKFIKKSSRKSVWVAWNDNPEKKKLEIPGIQLNRVKITEAVPQYERGQEVRDFTESFNTKIVSAREGIVLENVPVYIEEECHTGF
jgi:hypothetical protein